MDVLKLTTDQKFGVRFRTGVQIRYTG